jgi:hypothetical protein
MFPYMCALCNDTIWIIILAFTLDIFHIFVVEIFKILSSSCFEIHFIINHGHPTVQ